MEKLTRAQSIGIIAFVLLLPVLTSGQQSILLGPGDQTPPFPSNLSNNDSNLSDNDLSSNSKKSAPSVSVKPVVPVKPVSAAKEQKVDHKNLKGSLIAVESRQVDDNPVLNLVIQGTVARYETKQLQNPSRLVIDLFNVTSSKVRKTPRFSLGTVRIGVHADKTRVVIDIGQQAVPQYQVTQTDEGFQIRFNQSNSDLLLPVSVSGVPSSQLPAVSSQTSLSISDTEKNDQDNVADDSLLQPIQKQQIAKTLVPLSQQLISIDLRDADIRNVLRFMADASGSNIVVGDHVSGRVSIQLKNVPWQDALNAILQVAGLGYTQSDGIIRVLPLDALEKEQNSRLLNSQLAESNLPLVTQIFPVNYAAAQTLVPQIKEMLGNRGKVSVNERTNVLIVSDVQGNIDQINRLIQTLDTQTPQVLIEARMIEAKTEFSRSLGIQWGGSIYGVNGGLNPTGMTAVPSSVAPSGAVAPGPNYAVNLPVQQATSSIGVSFGTIGNMVVLNARISAAETDRQAKTVSMPKIMTLDNKPARITQGFQIPYTVVTNNIVQTQFVQAALQLDVIPHVTSDGAVQMSVKISQNMPDFSKRDNWGIPAIMLKEATTELLVRDGDTAVIGGIYTRNMLDGTQKTPFLGSIPVLGWLFKNSEKRDEQSEMLVFLTPRLLNRGQSTIDTSLVESK